MRRRLNFVMTTEYERKIGKNATRSVKRVKDLDQKPKGKEGAKAAVSSGAPHKG